MNVCQSYRFLLARLHLDSLAGETTAKSIKYTLKTLKSGARSLPQAYEDAIKRIESQTPSRIGLAKEVLSWIIIAERPLTVRELQHALAIEIGETELDEDNIPDVAEIISVCAGLVAIDKQSDIIRLVHYTTQEFFEHVEKAWIPQARSMVVKKCVTYLSFDTFLAGPAKSSRLVSPMLAENPFLNYAASYWGMHAFQLYSEEKSNAIVETHELALRFLRNESLVQSCGQVLLHVNPESIFRNYRLKGTGLHMAAFFGLADLCASFLEQRNDTKVEPDSSDIWGRTPLSYAAERGHVAVVKLLLERADADVNRTDSNGIGPLLYAVMRGHEAVVNAAVVKLLLRRAGIDVNCEGDNRSTPLTWAVVCGHEAVVKTLLERPEINAEYQDWSGWTPLRHAESRGHKGIVKLLKEHIASR